MDLLRQVSRHAAELPAEGRHAAFEREDRRTFDDVACLICDMARDRVINAVAFGPIVFNPPAAEIYTDASNEFIGGINEANQVFALAAPTTHNMIQTAELLGGVLAGVLFQARDWIWAVDNTVARYAIYKGHSASAAADEVLRFAFNLARAGILQLPTYVAWIPSACNRADPLTRPPESVGGRPLEDALQACGPACKFGGRHEAIEIPIWKLAIAPSTTSTTT
jgi:hypothetical protein